MMGWNVSGIGVGQLEQLVVTQVWLSENVRPLGDSEPISAIVDSLVTAREPTRIRGRQRPVENIKQLETKATRIATFKLDLSGMAVGESGAIQQTIAKTPVGIHTPLYISSNTRGRR